MAVLWWTRDMTSGPSFTVRSRPKRRGYETARDMVFSLGAVGVCIAVIMGVTHRPARDPIRVVDTAPVIAMARSAVTWQVLDPAPKLVEWRATSARFEREPLARVSIGWVTPDEQWIAFEQVGLPAGSNRARAWVRKVLDDAKNSGLHITGGDEQMTYLVHGTGSDAQLREVVAAAGMRP